MIKRVPLERLRNISRHRAINHAGPSQPSSNSAHDEQGLKAEQPLEPESRLVRS